MQNIAGFDFFPLAFDKDGKLTTSAELDALKRRAVSASDVIFLAHGFRNSEADATSLYTKFLTNFRAHFLRSECRALGGCDFAVAGVFWPSLALPETLAAQTGSTQSVDEDDPLLAAIRKKLNDLKTVAPSAEAQIDEAIQLLPIVKDDGPTQNHFAQLLLSTVSDATPDPTEGFDALRNLDGVTIIQKLSAPVILTTAGASGFDTGGALSLDDSGGSQSILSGFYSALGGIDRFINLTTWYVMKNRSGLVGFNGVAQTVRDLSASKPAVKIHLVGHSLGGRLMAACAKSLAQNPLCQATSVTLLEAAFSHFGFSADNGHGTPGFFRDVIAKHVSKGPLMATFSAQDTVVGTTYALASRLADDNAKAIGDATDPFGGIGRNGAINTTESVVNKLQKAGAPNGSPYQFQLGVVNCLDGSGGLIKDHGDVTNEDVTYAFACSVVSTQTQTASFSSSS
jgi:hypothetical protein